MVGGGLECLEKSRLIFITGSADFSRYIVHEDAKGLEEAAAWSSPGLSTPQNNGNSASLQKGFYGKKKTGLASKVQVNASFKETVPENKGMSDEEI